MQAHLHHRPGGFPRACCVLVLGLAVATGLGSIFAYLWHVGMLYVMDR